MADDATVSEPAEPLEATSVVESSSALEVLLDINVLGPAVFLLSVLYTAFVSGLLSRANQWLPRITDAILAAAEAKLAKATGARRCRRLRR